MGRGVVMIEVMEDGVARRSAAHPVTGTRPRRWVYLNTVVAVALLTPPGIFPVVLPQSRRTASRDSSLVSSWHLGDLGIVKLLGQTSSLLCPFSGSLLQLPFTVAVEVSHSSS